MKFIHLSDLHLGKRLHEVSLIADQEAILGQIVDIIDEEKPSAVFIAGDIYDKSVPSAEAVALFDNFLVQLVKRNLQIFVISGNHDSPERIAFGSKIMDITGVHLSPVYDGKISATTLGDEHGEVNIFMLPFVKPSHIRRFYSEEEIETYTDAVRIAIDKMNIDENKRNILVAHQFVTGAKRSESEETVGGTDNIDASVLKKFDYVALGHLHSAQYCDEQKIRYCGTPLKYSFSETDDTKSVSVVTLGEKGKEIEIKEVELKPVRDMKRIRGKFDDLMASPLRTDDFVQITLTDEDDIVNAMSRLQVVYKNALELRYDNARTRENNAILSTDGIENKTAYQLFADFYEKMNNTQMSEKQSEFVRVLIEKIEEEE